MKPFLLINKEASIPSWLGALTTILAYFLGVIFCLNDIKEVLYKITPTITEKPFYPIDDENFDISIPVIDKNLFRFSVEGSSNEYLDEKTITPKVVFQLFDHTTISNGSSSIYSLDVYKCPDNENQYCISPNQTQISKELLKIFVEKKMKSYLDFVIFPCTNETFNDSTTNENNYCLPQEEINEKLKTVTVSLKIPSNEFDINGMIFKRENSIIDWTEKHFFTSISKSI